MNYTLFRFTYSYFRFKYLGYLVLQYSKEGLKVIKFRISNSIKVKGNTNNKSLKFIKNE